MKWFEHEKDKTEPYRLKAPYDNVWVGSDPRDGMTLETAKSYQAIVNVSDSVCALFEPSYLGQAMHWYPVNEIGRWNLSYLYWLKKVMDFHHEQGHKIYLHCHAGAYRSPSAAVLWLLSRGHTPDEAISIAARWSTDNGLYRLWKSYDNVSPLYNDIFKLMRKQPTWSLGGIILRDHIYNKDIWNKEFMSGYSRRLHLKHYYFSWYYKPKWWINGYVDKIKYWLKGNGYFTEGIGTYYYPRKYFWAGMRDAEPKYLEDALVWAKIATNPPWWAKEHIK